MGGLVDVLGLAGLLVKAGLPGGFAGALGLAGLLVEAGLLEGLGGVLGLAGLLVEAGLLTARGSQTRCAHRQQQPRTAGPRQGSGRISSPALRAMWADPLSL